MNDTTQFIYNTKAIGQCWFDLSENSRKFNNMECLSCRYIHMAKASTELLSPADEVKKTNESSPD